MKKIIILILFLITNIEGQVEHQGVLKLNESNEVVTTYDWNDPNVIYWNSQVKNNGLGVKDFNLASLPIEIFSNSSQVVAQRNSVINEWNDDGCINIFDNPFPPSVTLSFESDDEFFPDTDITGRALSAVIIENSKYVFIEYSADSHTEFVQTAVILNNTQDFPLTWSTELSNQGTGYISFKPIVIDKKHPSFRIVGIVVGVYRSMEKKAG